MSLEQEQFEAPSLAMSRDNVGALLRQAREQRGQDMESVARALRIRHPYLVAIEEGRYRDLPGAPYASGFVRSYSEYLGLDAAEMLRRFREESGNMGARTELVFPAPVSEGGFPAAILIGVVIILAAVVYGIWYFYQWRQNSSAESVSVLPDRLAALIHAPGGEDRSDASSAQAAPTPPQPAAPATTSAAPAPAPTPAPAPQATTEQPAPATTAQAPQQTPAPIQPAPAPAAPPAATANPAPAPAAATNAQPAPVASPPAPAPAPTQQMAKAEPDSVPPAPAASPAPNASAGAPPAPDLSAPSRVVLRANEDCWVEIRDSSGAIVASRLMHKGDTYPVPPRPGLSLTVGNAGALSLLLDGNTMPPLGKTGMVRHDVSLDPDRVGKPAIAANPAPAPAPSDSPNN